MRVIVRYFTRIILLIIALLIYNNFRNNQCIKNNNCRPIFISTFFKKYKNFEMPSTIEFKIYDYLVNADLNLDKKFNKEFFDNINLKNHEHINSTKVKEFLNYHEKSIFMKDRDMIDIVYNNDIIIKKFIIKNTSSNNLKIKPSMKINDNIDKIKIYNCFCNNTIYLAPYEEKELYIYFSVEDIIAGSIDITIN
jgi:hypothetical protein